MNEPNERNHRNPLFWICSPVAIFTLSSLLPQKAAAGDSGTDWWDPLLAIGGPLAPAIPLTTVGALFLSAVLLGAGLLCLRTRTKRAAPLVILAAVVPLVAAAAQISTPISFTNGSTADADEVNANFNAVVDESNAQDVRLGVLEAVPPGISQATADLRYVNTTGGTITGPVQINGVLTTTSPAHFQDLFWANGSSFLGGAGQASFGGGAATISSFGTATFLDLIWANGSSFLGSSGQMSFGNGAATISGLGAASFASGAASISSGGTATFVDLIWANGSSFLGSAGQASFGNGAAAISSLGAASFGNGAATISSLGAASFASASIGNGAATMNADGEGSFTSVEITGGMDVAEPFEIGGVLDVIPGMLVAIDADMPGQLRVADRAYDRAVAGVVSGAGNMNPGVVLRQKGSAANGEHPVALTGRVYAWVDADANGAVEPGDLLTTSGTAGHAMRVTDYDRARGAVIGKAMTGQARGRGLVLVLVTLQ